MTIGASEIEFLDWLKHPEAGRPEARSRLKCIYHWMQAYNPPVSHFMKSDVSVTQRNDLIEMFLELAPKHEVAPCMKDICDCWATYTRECTEAKFAGLQDTFTARQKT